MKARTIMVALFMAAATSMAFAQEAPTAEGREPMQQQGPRRGGEEKGEKGRPMPQMQGQKPGGQGRVAPQRGGMNFMALEFTQEQLAKVNEINTEFKKKSILIKAEIQVAKIDLNSELYAANSNSKKITQLTEQINLKNGELMTEKNNHLLAIKALCTAEQLEKFAQMSNRGPQQHKQAPNKPQGNNEQGGRPQGGGRARGERPSGESVASAE